jgi:hypothetical protein
MGRVRHDLTAEIPEMGRQIVVFEIRDAREDARLFLHSVRGKRGVLNGDALRHQLLALDHVLAMKRVDERRFAGLAMPDENRPDALEFLGVRTVTVGTAGRRERIYDVEDTARESSAFPSCGLRKRLGMRC